MRERVVRLGLACLVLTSILAQGAGASASKPVEAVRYAIVVTGGELLSGAYADGHTHFLTRTL